MHGNICVYFVVKCLYYLDRTLNKTDYKIHKHVKSMLFVALKCTLYDNNIFMI